jgi:hypothetical protein
MKERVSAATNRRYPFTMICSVYRLARSSGYAAANGRDADAVSVKPGPRPEVSDESLLQLIRSEIESCPFVGEGHRKVHRRLNKRGIVVGRGRVLRLMRQDRLLVPQRTRRVHGNAAHDGTIVTERSNQMWGTDGTRFYTRRDGWCWFFGAIDHASVKVVGHHVAKIGDRFAALEPIKQGITENFGGYAGAIAAGRGRAFHADREGGMPLALRFRRPRAGSGTYRRFHRSLQSQVAHRAPRLPDTGRCASGAPPGGGVISAVNCPGNRVRYRLAQTGFAPLSPPTHVEAEPA